MFLHGVTCEGRAYPKVFAVLAGSSPFCFLSYNRKFVFCINQGRNLPEPFRLGRTHHLAVMSEYGLRPYMPHFERQ